MDVQATVVVDEAELPELVHEPTDPRAGGADHLRQDFLADLGITGSVFPSLPKRASNRSTRANRFSLELKS